ncbi:MAG: hypothetical protein H0V81_10960 [Solirubrobacterales bacterium]|nr:hypothetical protein [Solirubrobacterales bacterium]
MPRRLPPLSERSLLLLGGLAVLATIATGTAIRQTVGGLGTATPPFVIVYEPEAALGWALLAFLIAALAAVAAPRLAAATATGRTRWLCLTTLLALVPGLALNAARHGTSGWSEIFVLGPGGSFEAKNEYLPGLPALSYGQGFFLDRFAELVPSLPVNVAGHPPALMLLIDTFGLTTANRLAALCIAAAVLTPAVTYWIARAVGLIEERARLAAVLAALSPMLLLLGITSADAVFMLVGALTAALLADRRVPVRAVGCLALAVAAFFSWALLAIGAWAALLALVREGWRTALVLAAACGVAVLVFDGVLALAFGYDPIGTLRATEAYYRNSAASVRPYTFWLFGSPTAFAALLGLPTAAGLLLAARRRFPAGVALVSVIAIASVAGFTKAETERIWLPFVPLACVAAAEVLRPAQVRWIAPLMLLQALVVALLFQTIW